MSSGFSARQGARFALDYFRLRSAVREGWRDQFPMELVDDRGLPDAGISGYEHELRRAASDHPLERSAQAADLPLPPTQPLRDREAVEGIMRSERERVDPTLRLPFR